MFYTGYAKKREIQLINTRDDFIIKPNNIVQMVEDHSHAPISARV